MAGVDDKKPQNPGRRWVLKGMAAAPLAVGNPGAVPRVAASVAPLALAAVPEALAAPEAPVASGKGFYELVFFSVSPSKLNKRNVKAVYQASR